jgi:hypothetical protein
MSAASLRLARMGFLTLVTAGLIFGGRTVVASATRNTTCAFDPPTFVGTCTSQSQCQGTCELYWTEGPVQGDCDFNNCCSCVI